MLDTSDTVTVTDNGIAVTMTNGMPKVYYVSRSIMDDDDDDAESKHFESKDH